MKKQWNQISFFRYSLFVSCLYVYYVLLLNLYIYEHESPFVCLLTTCYFLLTFFRVLYLHADLVESKTPMLGAFSGIAPSWLKYSLYSVHHVGPLPTSSWTIFAGPYANFFKATKPDCVRFFFYMRSENLYSGKWVLQIIFL